MRFWPVFVTLSGMSRKPDPNIAEQLASALFHEISRMDDPEARRLLLLEIVYRAHGHLEAAG